ncbi:MAG: hypothetical protein KF745_02655 [Phycisphaeraceae bacterium]|nr:hypothetical protein [Phycisphaeraceae bacterium]
MNFDVLLSRVPGIGEHLSKGGDTYQVTAVQHVPLDEDGRASCGWHALLDAVLIPEPPPQRRRKTKQRR